MPTARGLRINNSAAVLQAAIEGHGVALTRSVRANDDLAAGRLVRLFPVIQFASVLAYHIVYRNECASLPRLNGIPRLDAQRDGCTALELFFGLAEQS